MTQGQPKAKPELLWKEEGSQGSKATSQNYLKAQQIVQQAKPQQQAPEAKK